MYLAPTHGTCMVVCEVIRWFRSFTLALFVVVAGLFVAGCISCGGIVKGQTFLQHRLTRARSRVLMQMQEGAHFIKH